VSDGVSLAGAFLAAIEHAGPRLFVVGRFIHWRTVINKPKENPWNSPSLTN
jgi:hypothetical protein